MNDFIDQLIDRLHDANQPMATMDARASQWSTESVVLLVQRLDELPDLDQLVIHQVNCLLRSIAQVPARTPPTMQGAAPHAERVASLYGKWRQSRIQRHLLLTHLARCADADSWRVFAELMVTDPPSDDRQVIEAFVPVWQRADGPLECLFPRILDAIQHPSVVAVVLDLANYVVRQRGWPSHPAAPRADELTRLLGRLVERLEQFEEASLTRGVADLAAAKTVAETVAIAVALSHAVALMDHRAATGKLFRMMQLRHRRLRIEAAYALARFHEDDGVRVLTEMAAEPLVRLRAHAYAAELGMLDQVAAEFRTPEALAEAEMVVMLSEPDFFGYPPSACELIDQRALYWPGYDGPVTCYLFRFCYQFAESELVNLGIVGPLTHCLRPNLAVFETDDVYAIFAGLQVEHEDLRRWELSGADAPWQAQLQRVLDHLHGAGMESIEPAFWASDFEGQRRLIARARRQGQAVMVAASDTDHAWISCGDPARPLDADTAHAYFIGRQLLSEFNDDWGAADG